MSLQRNILRYVVRVKVCVGKLPDEDEDTVLRRERDLCEKVTKELKRRDDVYSAETIRETYDTCSFCGASWVEDEHKPHNGGCCDEDVKEMSAHHGSGSR